jgi:hypothetical protein
MSILEQQPDLRSRIAAVVPDDATRWSALRFDLRGVAKREQLALWRELRRLRALKLCPATWAIAHGIDGTPPLDRALDLLAASLGSVEVVDPDLEWDEPSLHQSVRVACRRLWDTFFNELDHVMADLTRAGAEIGDVHERACDELVASFVELRARDLLGDDALRARGRLYECLRSLSSSSNLEPNVTKPRRPTTVLNPIRGVALRNGLIRFEAVLEPTPTLAWERRFHAFEELVYLPAPDRPPLELRTFVFTTPPDGAAPMVAGIARRIALFEQSLPA